MYLRQGNGHVGEQTKGNRGETGEESSRLNQVMLEICINQSQPRNLALQSMDTYQSYKRRRPGRCGSGRSCRHRRNCRRSRRGRKTAQLPVSIARRTNFSKQTPGRWAYIDSDDICHRGEGDQAGTDLLGDGGAGDLIFLLDVSSRPCYSG